MADPREHLPPIGSVEGSGDYVECTPAVQIGKPGVVSADAGVEDVALEPPVAHILIQEQARRALDQPVRNADLADEDVAAPGAAEVADLQRMGIEQPLVEAVLDPRSPDVRSPA